MYAYRVRRDCFKCAVLRYTLGSWEFCALQGIVWKLKLGRIKSRDEIKRYSLWMKLRKINSPCVVSVVLLAHCGFLNSLQIIGWLRFTVYFFDIEHPCYDELTSVKKKVFADQYHVTILRAQVYNSSRSRVFSKLTADQILVFDLIAGSSQINL